MRYYRRQGWLEFGPTPQGTVPPTTPVPRAATTESGAELQAAAKTVARKLPRPASKTTQGATTPPAGQRGASTGKRRAPAKQPSAKKRKSGKFVHKRLL
jgi:hypothetical protein